MQGSLARSNTHTSKVLQAIQITPIDLLFPQTLLGKLVTDRVEQVSMKITELTVTSRLTTFLANPSRGRALVVRATITPVLRRAFPVLAVFVLMGSPGPSARRVSRGFTWHTIQMKNKVTSRSYREITKTTGTS